MLNEDMRVENLLVEEICKRAKQMARIIMNNNNVEIRPSKKDGFVIYEANFRKIRE